jgi:hypothetical protein
VRLFLEQILVEIGCLAELGHCLTHVTLLCIGNGAQLFPQRCDWILILSLLEDNSFNELV